MLWVETWVDYPDHHNKWGDIPRPCHNWDQKKKGIEYRSGIEPLPVGDRDKTR